MNPHFIFNSFNSIQRLFLEEKTDLASDYMADFAVLMRSTLDNSNQESVSLKEEIDLLKVYLDLEKLRSQKGFDYEIDIDDSVDELTQKVPPLIIQPFTENAIWHGVLPKKEKGLIRVSVRFDDKNGYLVIAIEDNGVGFSAGQKPSDHKSKGMAISQMRLKYPIIIEAIDMGGTRVILKI